VKTIPALADVAAVNAGILRRSHLSAAGLSSPTIGRLVRDGELVRVHRDAYRLPVDGEHPLTQFEAAVTALRLRDPNRVLTGPAALTVLGLPVFDDPGTLHVVTDRRGGSSARSLVTTVAPPPADQMCDVQGTTVTCAARAALDTARLHSLVAGVVAADAALRADMTTVAELERVASTMSRLHGAADARLCRELASPFSESPGESWSAVVMHQHRLPRPERQELFRDGRGIIGRSDFWWPQQRVAGEFDGKVKYGRRNPSGRPPEDVLWDEKIREDRLRGTGVLVVRWTTADLYHPREWIRRLRAALR
jgi:hypothetical protein